MAAAWPLGASGYRPFDSTDAAVAARTEVEVELGPVGYLVEGTDRTLVAPSLVLNWGFADRWEVVIEGRHLVELGTECEKGRVGVEDVALSLKRVLRTGGLQERVGPSIATELSALVPAIGGESGAGAEATLIVSQRWTDLTVHVNGAATWTRAHVPGAFVGIVLEGHDAWTVRPVTEVFVEGEHDSRTTVSGLIGAIWRVSDALSFDAAVRRARAGGVSTAELRLGLTFGFGVGLPR